MRKFSSEQFDPNDAWIVFRVDVMVKDDPVDVYILMDAASTYVFGFAFAVEELPDSAEVEDLMENAFRLKNSWPKMFLFPGGDPAEDMFREHSEKRSIPFQVFPPVCFENIIAPVKQSFGQYFYSPLASSGGFDPDSRPTDEQLVAQAFIPDSYHLCSCASGLKYKFCCKPVFREITEAMAAAEEGRHKAALKWMKKAEKKVGRTPEILCRYSIVYSFFDLEKSEKYLNDCLERAPHHPRGNYIRGICLSDLGDYKGALESYRIAIKHYPPTDKYHLNETWNNIGTTSYHMGNYEDAKMAWETALLYLPEDPVALDNLNDFIYENPAVPEGIKGSRSIH